MAAFASQQTLIPAAAGFDIGDGDERLGAHLQLTSDCERSKRP
jgi:hypothetical protein